jgi:hypothetical protein
VEVGGCRSAPLSEQRGERESERGRRRSAREDEMEGGGVGRRQDPVAAVGTKIGEGRR